MPPERWYLDIVALALDVDQLRVAAGIVEAGPEQPLHAEVTHVTERHRRAEWMLLIPRRTRRRAARADRLIPWP
jgi:hypothetical protein